MPKVRRDKQLSLELVRRAKKPGKRMGRPRSRRGVPHEKREGFASKRALSVTLKMHPSARRLRTRKLYAALHRVFCRACEKGRFRLVHYSVQHSHVHLVVEANCRADMTRGMRSVNNMLAHAVNSALGRKRGTVLADRYHERHLTSPRKARNALAYVLNNYRHHAADRGERLPQSWIDPLSSARFFDGFQNRSHEPPAKGDPVAAPRTWMLRCGWKKGGLISTAYVPGLSQTNKN